jgi:catechol 2,3-dioxygenase-like lactoylglutathione lyase family enzyme
MKSIETVTLEVSDLEAAEKFYASAFGSLPPLRLVAGDAPTSGFRGFTLSLLVSQPASVDDLFGTALAAGAEQLKPAKRQLWGGYSGVLRAPDGTIWKVATDAKKNTGPASRAVDKIALILGVADMAAAKRLYVERGLNVAKSFGGKYAEFEAPGESIKLGLYKRRGLAKDAGVDAAGSGSHRLVIGPDADHFTDPDGFVWEPAPAVDRDDAGRAAG